MRQLTQRILCFCGCLYMLLPQSASSQSLAVPAIEPAAHFLGWPKVGSAENIRLLPMTEKRIGFTLGPETAGQRVVIAIAAFLESDKPGGYNSDALAVDVNGEKISNSVCPAVIYGHEQPHFDEHLLAPLAGVLYAA